MDTNKGNAATVNAAANGNTRFLYKLKELLKEEQKKCEMEGGLFAGQPSLPSLTSPFEHASLMATSPSLPFELRVLEICLDEVSKDLSQCIQALESTLYPATDSMAKKVRPYNLERLRRAKRKLDRLTNTVQHCVLVIEGIIDTPSSLLQLNLTALSLHAQIKLSQPDLKKALGLRRKNALANSRGFARASTKMASQSLQQHSKALPIVGADTEAANATESMQELVQAYAVAPEALPMSEAQTGAESGAETGAERGRETESETATATETMQELAQAYAVSPEALPVSEAQAGAETGSGTGTGGETGTMQELLQAHDVAPEALPMSEAQTGAETGAETREETREETETETSTPIVPPLGLQKASSVGLLLSKPRASHLQRTPAPAVLQAKPQATHLQRAPAPAVLQAKPQAAHLHSPSISSQEECEVVSALPFSTPNLAVHQAMTQASPFLQMAAAQPLRGSNGHALSRGSNRQPPPKGSNGHQLSRGSNGHALPKGSIGHPLTRGANAYTRSSTSNYPHGRISLAHALPAKGSFWLEGGEVDRIVVASMVHNDVEKVEMLLEIYLLLLVEMLLKPYLLLLVEMLLEPYLILLGIQDYIVDVESSVNIRLDSTRNMLLSIGIFTSAVVAYCAFVTGICGVFSMNLTPSLELDRYYGEGGTSEIFLSVLLPSVAIPFIVMVAWMSYLAFYGVLMLTSG
eukprot:gene16800-23079_t